jgi:hypothetical protein
MKYLITIDEETGLWSHPVGPEEEAYLRTVVFPSLRSLTEDEYRGIFAPILGTAAPYSYVLDGDMVYWCITWEPGLVVVQFAPDGSLALAERRSPNPQFGGREATEEELARYEEDNEEETRQYHLVFTAWDARFDEEEREDWGVEDDLIRSRFDAALGGR